MDRNNQDESIRQINFANQEMAIAYQKLQELKEHFEKSYSHFVEASKHSKLLNSDAYENSFSEVNKGIEQLEKGFDDSLIQKMVNSSVNQI